MGKYGQNIDINFEKLLIEVELKVGKRRVLRY